MNVALRAAVCRSARRPSQLTGNILLPALRAHFVRPRSFPAIQFTDLRVRIT
jgi:hypothetical protein